MKHINVWISSEVVFFVNTLDSFRVEIGEDIGLKYLVPCPSIYFSLDYKHLVHNHDKKRIRSH